MGVEIKYPIELINRFEVSNMEMNIWLIREKIWALGFLKIKEPFFVNYLKRSFEWIG